MANTQHARSPQQQLKKGERLIGDYVLGKSIGEGTFGKVKVGTHRPTGEKVRLDSKFHLPLEGSREGAPQEQDC